MKNHWTSHLVLVGAIAAILYVAGVPILAYLPLLVFLACPVLMFVMMRTMIGHDSNPPAHTDRASVDRLPDPKHPNEQP